MIFNFIGEDAHIAFAAVVTVYPLSFTERFKEGKKLYGLQQGKLYEEGEARARP